MPPRLIRRTPLMKRIKDQLDVHDILLRLAELVNDDSYDEWLTEWSVSIGVGLNVLFILAKLANKPGLSSSGDDVFGDFEGKRSTGWFGWIVSIHRTLYEVVPFWRMLMIWYTGSCSHTYIDALVSLERLLHLLSKTALPTVRATRRCNTSDAIREARPRRQLAHVFVAFALPTTRYLRSDCFRTNIPRSKSRSLGGQHVGSQTIQPYTLYTILAWTFGPVLFHAPTWAT